MICDQYINQFLNSTSLKDIQNVYSRISYLEYQKISLLIVANTEVSCFKLALSTVAKCFGVEISYCANSQGTYDDIIFLTEDISSCKKMYATIGFGHSKEQIDNYYVSIIQEIDDKVAQFSDKFPNADIYLNTLSFFLYSPLGIQDGINFSTDDFISQINHDIRQKLLSKYNRVHIIPHHRYSTTITRSLWDDRPWMKISTQLSGRYINNLLYPALNLFHYLYPKYNQRIKGMVLDLDDTLWGGTLAEDGEANIQLNDNYPGYYYTRLQENIKCLENKGVFSTIASKNHMEDVNTVINHKKEYFVISPSIVKADLTTSKVQMINDICRELNNINLDTLLFIDNSDLERSNVSTAYDNIKVPEYNGNIALQEELFLRMPYIEKSQINQEDLNRSQWHHKTNGNSSFKIDIKMLPYEQLSNSLSRIYDLIWNTNQFNMTTNRLSESVICEKIDKKQLLVFQSVFSKDSQLSDEIFSIIVLDELDNALVIENFLMSCRYLGFGLDKKVFNHAINVAKAKGKKYIIGKYKFSERNRVVQNWYQRMHFLLISKGSEEDVYRCLVTDIDRIIGQENTFDLQEYLNSNITLKCNSDTVARVREKDHSQEVFVPSSKIKYGLTIHEATILENVYGLYPESDRNDNTIDVNGFWIDKYCITNEQYAHFLNSNYARIPERIHILEQILHNQPCCKLVFDNIENQIKVKPFADKLPVVVGFEYSRLYAKWVGGRLPDEYEWEVAAGGSDNRWFPWGNELPDFKYVSIDATNPSPVDSYPQNISPFGLVQTVGNVWQWCEGEYNGHNVYRGGDYRFDGGYWKRVQLRPIESAEHCGNQVGFRVVRDE